MDRNWTTLGLSAATDVLSIEAARSASVPQLPGYELGELLGEGSFGQVWGGVQLATGLAVAVKVMRGSAKNEVDAIVRAVQHPNVVSILDANLEHAPPFFVTSRLSASLGGILRAGEVVTPGQVWRWFSQVAGAVWHLHRQGLAHCDLKPDNILLDSGREARLADFGQARAFQAAHPDGGSLGTYYYMPPEQARIGPNGRQVETPNPCWDIYALGATFYVALTGHLPRGSRVAREQLLEHESGADRLNAYVDQLLYARLVPIAELCHNVDPVLASTIERCLMLDPDARFSGVDKVLAALQRPNEARSTASPAWPRELAACAGVGLLAWLGWSLPGLTYLGAAVLGLLAGRWWRARGA